MLQWEQWSFHASALLDTLGIDINTQSYIL